MSSTIQRHLKQSRPFNTLEEEVFVGLQLVSDRLMQPWAAYLKESADLSHVQYNVLRILRGAGKAGLSAGEVGERLITRSPDVTRLIDRLEKRGLVERHPDARDRRAVRIFITAAGLDLLRQLDQHGHECLTRALGRVSTEELATLRAALETVLDAVAH